jgi:hypothetical protein
MGKQYSEAVGPWSQIPPHNRTAIIDLRVLAAGREGFTMTTHGSDKVFGSSMAEVYERYLVPLIFTPYAADLSKTVAASRDSTCWRSPREPAP